MSKIKFSIAKIFLAIISLSIGIGISGNAGAYDGATLYATKTCIACHGQDAKTPLLPIYPKLAGQNKAYAIAQMADIKSGARDNGQTAAMKGIMYIINDAEREAIAEWLASLPQDEPGDATAEGAKLYHDKVCSTCHGANAKMPVQSNYPKILGQNKEYTLAQMKDIKNGVRNNAQSAVMKAFMDRFNVTDAEMEAIAEWLASSK